MSNWRDNFRKFSPKVLNGVAQAETEAEVATTGFTVNFWDITRNIKVRQGPYSLPCGCIWQYRPELVVYLSS